MTLRRVFPLTLVMMFTLIWANAISAFSAANSFPPSIRVMDTTYPVDPNQFLPTECQGRVTVTNIIAANPGGTTNAGAASSLIVGSSLNDTINGQGGTDCIVGGAGADTLSGGAGTGVFLGGLGDDILSGGGGADYLYGQDGNDDLNGGIGNDFLSGGNGTDTCDGGAGTDTTDGTCETTNRIP